MEEQIKAYMEVMKQSLALMEEKQALIEQQAKDDMQVVLNKMASLEYKLALESQISSEMQERYERQAAALARSALINQANSNPATPGELMQWSLAYAQYPRNARQAEGAWVWSPCTVRNKLWICCRVQVPTSALVRVHVFAGHPVQCVTHFGLAGVCRCQRQLW